MEQVENQLNNFGVHVNTSQWLSFHLFKVYFDGEPLVLIIISQWVMVLILKTQKYTFQIDKSILVCFMIVIGSCI